MTRRPANAGRRPDIEKSLTERGFTWEYRHSVPLDDFDWDRSQHNQARLGTPLQVDIVERYKAALINGDLFPGVVTSDQKTSGLLIVDGNHRYAAHLDLNRSVDAYVITNATPQAITMLTFEANTKHGLPTNETERIHHALWLVDNGMTAEDAAKRLGLKPHTLRAAANQIAAARRADDAGILRNDWERLSPAAINRINQISTDEGFAAMARLAIGANLSSPEVAEVVKELATLRSSSKQVEYVTAMRDVFAERLQTGGVSMTVPRGRQSRTPRQHLSMVLGQLHALPSVVVISEHFTDDDRDVYAGRLDEAIEHLTAIRKALAE